LDEAGNTQAVTQNTYAKAVKHVARQPFQRFDSMIYAIRTLHG